MSNDECSTPDWLIVRVREFFGGSISLDPCTNEFAQEKIQAKKFYMIDDDGLSKDWFGRSVWLNPPYSNPLPWCMKLNKEAMKRNVFEGLLLVNSMTETKYYQHLSGHHLKLIFNKRINFYSDGKLRNRNDRQQTMFYVGCRSRWFDFFDCFKDLGVVCAPFEIFYNLFHGISALGKS